MRAVLGVAAALLIAGQADAGWKKIHTSGGDYLTSVSVTAGGHLFAGGFAIDPASPLPIPTAALFASDDGGKTLDPIDAALGGASGGLGTLGAVDAIAFLDGTTGWVALDGKAHRTGDRGATWTPAELGGTARALHFFDSKRGYAVGKGGFAAATMDGGASWEPVQTGTQADLGCMFWVDGLRGWAAGQAETTETDYEGQESTTVAGGAVLTTTDGGQSWTTGYQTSGHVLCPLFFLPDGRTGFLATSEKPSGDHGTAHLLRTTDGGASFEDAALPAEVGTLDMFIKVPIRASYVTAMYWSDAQTGHLAGSAYLTDASSGMGGSTPVYKTVDFLTRDGGGTWEKTDLGTVTVNIMGGQAPSGDGTTIGGAMSSLLDGVMVGDGGTVWRFEGACAADGDCGAGARCDEALCVTVPAAEPCEGSVCNVAAGAAGGGGGGDGGGEGDAAGSGGGGGGVSAGADAAGGSGGGGCESGRAGANRWWVALLGLAMMVGARRRRATE